MKKPVFLGCFLWATAIGMMLMIEQGKPTKLTIIVATDVNQESAPIPDTHTMTQNLGHDGGPFTLTPDHGNRNWQMVRKKKCLNNIPEDKEKGIKQRLEKGPPSGFFPQEMSQKKGRPLRWKLGSLCF